MSSSINFADLSEVYDLPGIHDTPRMYKPLTNKDFGTCSYSKECRYCHRNNTIQPYNDDGKISYCKFCNREFASIKLHSQQNFVKYSKKCVYCGKHNTYPITNDGGSIGYCNLCKKSFKATVEYE